jgi:uncharacterized protein YbbK (DUF523 family)
MLKRKGGNVMKVVVSACLLGENCKYNGGNNFDPKVAEFVKGREVIPVCPEVLAGLGIPRIPMEIVNGRVINRDGQDLDDALRAAAAQILEQLSHEDVECVILKSRSPTCGVKEVYDGTFSGRRIPGQGTPAAALLAAGYRVIDAEDL